ncbi:hypothetical protein FE784_11775 [Paenibacillus hemerocallicola]|uniref:Uncharacterized protein n=1 Tax=Paenibacillus hemerocallicola TaxID=1172614 RepID=A0A5C4TB26_9BACL|nr:hypothetical protein [Paenibacillus hemerocallicola]TNJ66092.1 hypothetical protein FE784_11775 [Paenibacillus hemerocallicola]
MIYGLNPAYNFTRTVQEIQSAPSFFYIWHDRSYLAYWKRYAAEIEGNSLELDPVDPMFSNADSTIHHFVEQAAKQFVSAAAPNLHSASPSPPSENGGVHRRLSVSPRVANKDAELRVGQRGQPELYIGRNDENACGAPSLAIVFRQLHESLKRISVSLRELPKDRMVPIRRSDRGMFGPRPLLLEKIETIVDGKIAQLTSIIRFVLFWGGDSLYTTSNVGAYVEFSLIRRTIASIPWLSSARCTR